MVSCRFCGLTCPNVTRNSLEFDFDDFNTGFWCNACEGFNYLDSAADKHRFILILEDKTKDNYIKKAGIKLNKRLSPFRYPGGKSKLIDYLYYQLNERKTQKLVSAYSGGASFELAMLDAGIINQLHLNDIDMGIYSFWWVIKHMPFALISRLRENLPTHKEFYRCQKIIKQNYIGVDMVEAAWAVLVVNRLAYSGIYSANPLGGKNGPKEKLLSRWNPNELVKRIEHVHGLSDRIEVTQLNALELIEEEYWLNESTLFLDPPYVKAGKELYNCYYTENDHRELNSLLEMLHMCFAGSDIILTYDYNKMIDNMYNYPDIKHIGRTYSI